MCMPVSPTLHLPNCFWGFWSRIHRIYISMWYGIIPWDPGKQWSLCMVYSFSRIHKWTNKICIPISVVLLVSTLCFTFVLLHVSFLFVLECISLMIIPHFICLTLNGYLDCFQISLELSKKSAIIVHPRKPSTVCKLRKLISKELMGQGRNHKGI